MGGWRDREERIGGLRAAAALPGCGMSAPMAPNHFSGAVGGPPTFMVPPHCACSSPGTSLFTASQPSAPLRRREQTHHGSSAATDKGSKHACSGGRRCRPSAEINNLMCNNHKPKSTKRQTTIFPSLTRCFSPFHEVTNCLPPPWAESAKWNKRHGLLKLLQFPVIETA